MTEENVKPLSPEEVAEIVKRTAKASLGPWTNADAKRGRCKSVWLSQTAHEQEEMNGAPSRYGPHRDYVANTFHLDYADFISHSITDIPRLIATIAAKDAEIAEARRELAAKDTTPHRHKTPAVRAYPVELTIVDVPVEIPRYEASKTPDPCANGHDKCFSSNVIATWPPYYPWIRRRCGAEGEDHGAYAARDEYECLRQRKAVPQGEDEKP